MELKGRSEKGFPYSVILDDNGLFLVEEDDSGNMTTEFISLDEIKFVKGTGNLIIKLKKADRLIKVREIKNYKLINEFVELANKNISNKQLNKVKQKENKNNGLLGWWDGRPKEDQIVIGILGICLIMALIFGVNAVLGPKITPLSITEPKNISNSDIGKYAYKNITIDNSTNQITISGKTDSEATVTAYVKYNYGNDADAQDIRVYGTLSRDVAIDPNTGVFSFRIDVNPTDPGPSYVFVEAKSPNKKDNGVELIILYPVEIKKTTIHNELKEPINNFIDQNFSKKNYWVLQYYKVEKVINDNEIELELAVDCPDPEGKTTYYHSGRWVKTNGIWISTPEFKEDHYTTRSSDNSLWKNRK